MVKNNIKGLFGRLIRILFRSPTYARSSEAVNMLLRHSTLKRIINLFVVEMEFRLRKTRVSGKPYVLVIDPTNVCNLRCPLCPTGLHNPGRKSQMLQWETYAKTIDQLSPWAYKVNLFNWGESLLHNDIVNMIRYAVDRNLATTLSTNFSIKISDEMLDGIINSGLEFLCLSIDGTTQESYSTYRRKGDLELVLNNVKRLVKRREVLGKSKPVIEWQFIPMRHNEQETEKAKQLSQEFGIDRFRVIPVGIPFDSPEPEQLKDEWFPVNITNGQTSDGEEIASNDQAQTSCYFLYRYLVVNPDGKTSPCCVVYGEKNDFGDLSSSSFTDSWNNDHYTSGRAHFNNTGKITVPTVCDRCNLFAKKQSK